MDFCSSENSIKKSHLYVVLFSTGHFTKKIYVAMQFSLPQGGKNQMVVFFFFTLDLGFLF
jgi:hypothetical protein